jgi:glycosyltransferase involved in cell wall biosynthesis
LIALPPLTPAALDFVLLSFEGPDEYSMAGGLGVRMKQLSLELARQGFRTHLVFLGDPALPAEESPAPNLTLHRWAQWLSAEYPAGVYDGEEAKLAEWNRGVPDFVVSRLIAPAAAEGRLIAVLAEEWHTAFSACEISDRLWDGGLRGRALMLWNANNVMGFDRIDWARLAYCAQLTTVSKYMKHVMWARDVNPLVIPNGIPSEHIRDADPLLAAEVREAFGDRELVFKIGRFSPDKRWIMAVDALATEKDRGRSVAAVIRGGLEPHGGEVLTRARARGLDVVDIVLGGDPAAAVAQLRQAPRVDIYNVTNFLAEPVVSLLYSSADAVLANSGHEPFGLVGLEVMAAGGVAFLGATGEDYAVSFFNSVVLDTDDPLEINVAFDVLRSHPEITPSLRVGARETARSFTWQNVVVDNLLNRLRYVALCQLVISPPGESSRTPAAPGEMLGLPAEAEGPSTQPGPKVSRQTVELEGGPGSLAYGGRYVDGRLAISPRSTEPW